MMGFKFIEDYMFECETCGAKVPSGIISISGHWAECAGKETMDFVNKVDKSGLHLKDKMDIIKKQFNIEQ